VGKLDRGDDEVGAGGSTSPAGFPAERTSFVGRRRELRELHELLFTARLVTILGAAGSGKSRLAQRVARAAASRHRDGAWYVGVGSVPHADRLTTVVAEVVGLPRAGNADLDTLVDWLTPKDGLLLLDDCEHLAEACAQLVDRLVAAGSNVRMLVTSREPLGVTGEVLWALTPLQIPRGSLRPTIEEALQWDAVRLLVERATAVRHDFCVEQRNLEAVVAICRKLDGLPLALEFAAARFSHLTGDEIAARLDDRFRLLTSHSRAGGGRHQTLEEAIDWSHDLLDATEQAVLRRAAVFVDGCTVAGAEAVCAADDLPPDQVLDALASLTEKSFLVAEVRAATTHYRFLETVHDYARQRLEEHGEVASASERHARWHHAWTGAGERDGSAGWLAAVVAAHDDVAAAIRWASHHGEPDLALGLAAGLWRACEVTSRFSEGRDLLHAALDAPGWTDANLRSRVLDGAASLALLQGDLDEAGRLHTEALASCREHDDPEGEAAAVRSLGLVALLSGDVATARTRSEDALEAFRHLGDERGIAFSLATFGLVHRAAGDITAASAAFGDSLERLDRLGLDRHAADVLSNLGDLAFDSGDLPRARGFYRAAEERYRASDDERGAALALNNLSLVAQQQGDIEAAVETCTDAVGRFRSIGDRQATAAALNNLANLTIELGDRAQAREHYGASMAIYTELKDPTGTSLLRQHLAELDRNEVAVARDEDILTAREDEVVGLVADGLANRDIAERLFISERTVESHIAHARRKLDVTSRTQLVRWVLDHRSGTAAPTG
jgi:predicted ATPase/DNA-binding CsgD family transcriptional regulator